MRNRDRWLGYGCLALGAALLIRMLAVGRWNENAIGSFGGFAVLAALLYAGFDLLRRPRERARSQGESETSTDLHQVRLSRLIALGYAGCLVVGLPMIIGACMGFDAPNSEHSVVAWTFLAVAVTTPVLTLLLPVIVRKSIAAGNVRTAYLLVSLALLPYVVVLAGYMLMQLLRHHS